MNGMQNRHKGILGSLRRWLSRDAPQESLARQILYQGQLPLGRRIRGRLMLGSKLLLRMWEVGWRARFKEPRSSLKLDGDFESVIARVADSEGFDARALLPYLCAEGTDQRAYVNMRLAEACLQIDTPKRLGQARVFAERAWILSGFSVEILPLYERILLAIGDADALREAYKRIGIAVARNDSFVRAIHYFDLWQYGYHRVERADRYAYDFDICHAVEEMAAPYRFHPSVLSPQRSERIRVAHLVRGLI